MGIPSSAALVFSVVACGREASPAAAKRVILITCDTLRSDHLGCYGYARPTSPRVDELAGDARVFDNAWSTAPKTTPAVAALMTGRLPDEIGVTGGNFYLLPPAAVTLAEVVSAAGLPTGAVVSNWVLHHQPEYGGAGVAQGFQHFDDEMGAREVNRDMYERGAPDTTDAAIRWLEERRRGGEDRFFLWVHYQDPHGPYQPPRQSLARCDRPPTDEPELPFGTTPKGLGQIPSYQVLDSERRPEPYRARYDGEIVFFDQHLGRLLDWLRQADWYRDALILFTADHGEALGEHGYWFCHGENVYAEVVHVPLIVRFPDGRQGRVTEPVGHLDLWPTVLQALGLHDRPGNGLSLFRDDLPERRILQQTLGRAGRDRWIGLGDGRWHLVTHVGKGSQLFDHAQDPLEAVDLVASRPDVVQELARLRDEYVAAHGEAELDGSQIEADDEVRRRLGALGYAEEDER